MYTYTKQGKAYRVERAGRVLGTVERGTVSRTKAAKGGRWTSTTGVGWIAKGRDGATVGAGHKTRKAAAAALAKAAGLK